MEITRYGWCGTTSDHVRTLTVHHFTFVLTSIVRQRMRSCVWYLHDIRWRTNEQGVYRRLLWRQKQLHMPGFSLWELLLEVRILWLRVRLLQHWLQQCLRNLQFPTFLQSCFVAYQEHSSFVLSRCRRFSLVHSQSYAQRSLRYRERCDGWIQLHRIQVWRLLQPIQL